MAQTSTSWRNGQSGNPKGRPTMRTRPLATVLREVGAEHIADRENRTAVANLIWHALRTGNLELDSGKHIDLTAKEWLDLVKWVHVHIDGGLQRKEQYAEARDQQSQIEETFADLDALLDADPPAASTPEPAAASIPPEPIPQPQP